MAIEATVVVMILVTLTRAIEEEHDRHRPGKDVANMGRRHDRVMLEGLLQRTGIRADLLVVARSALLARIFSQSLADARTTRKAGTL